MLAFSEINPSSPVPIFPDTLPAFTFIPTFLLVVSAYAVTVFEVPFSIS